MTYLGTYDGESLESFFSHDCSESVWDALVKLGVNLLSAFDDIHWTNCHVCKAAGKNATNHALSVVTHIVNVSHFSMIFLW